MGLGEREMLENHQHDYNAAALDPDLLSTPFNVQTKWHVITGAPCSGKSTLIDQLADSGFRTALEAARQYYEREMATGRAIEEIREDVVPLVHGILNMMLEIERGLGANEVVCLDRGYPDALAFCRQFELDPNEFLPGCFHHRYASVFMLDRFPVQLDGVRVEDEAAADYLDEWHYRDYTALGYEVVRVPILSPKERLEFVLEKLSEQELQ
jgi:predicted ATPase